MLSIDMLLQWKKDQIVGHLKNRNSGRFANFKFYFLRANHRNTFQVEVRGQMVNLGDGKGCNTMYSSVLRRRKVHKIIDQRFIMSASNCLLLNT